MAKLEVYPGIIQTFQVPDEVKHLVLQHTASQNFRSGESNLSFSSVNELLSKDSLEDLGLSRVGGDSRLITETGGIYNMTYHLTLVPPQNGATGTLSHWFSVRKAGSTADNRVNQQLGTFDGPDGRNLNFINNAAILYLDAGDSFNVRSYHTGHSYDYIYQPYLGYSAQLVITKIA